MGGAKYVNARQFVVQRNSYVAATARGKQIYACVRVNFRQYFVCLRERIFHCCDVLSQVKVEVPDRIAAAILQILLIYGRHFPSFFRFRLRRRDMVVRRE